MTNKLVYLGLIAFAAVVLFFFFSSRPQTPDPNICLTPPEQTSYDTAPMYLGPMAEEVNLKNLHQLTQFAPELQAALAQGNNFASHFVLVPVSCGGNCYKHVIIHGQTGTVYFYGLSSPIPATFSSTSSLITVNPPGVALPGNTTRYYNFSSNTMHLICHRN